MPQKGNTLKSSYVLTEISENKRFYKMGLANIQLTILLDDYDGDAKKHILL